MKKTVFLIILLGVLLSLVVSWRVVTYARQAAPQALVTSGTWQAQNQDLLYVVAFSSLQQPDGPLVVYRAAASDLHNAEPVIAFERDPLVATPLLFPSPDGRYFALLTPSTSATDTLTVLSSDGTRTLHTLTWHINGVVRNDAVVWSSDSQALYYHQVVSYIATGEHPLKGTVLTGQAIVQPTGYEEIHRVDIQGQNAVVMHQKLDSSSLRLVGLDATGALIIIQVRPHQPVSVFRIAIDAAYGPGQLQPLVKRSSFVMNLPYDILPGNVLRVGADGESLECERVVSWSPLRYQRVRIAFMSGAITPLMHSFYDARETGTSSNTSSVSLTRSQNGQVQVAARVVSVRTDLAAQGIEGVPSQEILMVKEQNATQQLTLPPGGQVIQAVWTNREAMAQWHIVPADVLAGLLAFHKRMTNTSGLNASPIQQDEWMLEGHAGILTDAPTLPTMCYGTCPNGATGHPHVSASVLHGVAFTESNWHQFNTLDYHIQNEQAGTPLESFDGGWGEFQQTWGMPPQCVSISNCRSDVSKVEYDQSYNISVGVASLIGAWNATAGVASSSNPNDPYKANDWFFAVWAYNGTYGNNPNDVASSVYGHWYPGAPFRSIYEEYVWYFAAHSQNATSGWTDNYLPNLGSSLLPPQSDFTGTSDSFVNCVTCTIPDWTSGGYDRAWVGVGLPSSTLTASFTATFTLAGGEDIAGLPRDNGGGAAAHRWGNGWTQDFGGGSYLPGAIMLAGSTTNAYWVYGGVWVQYLNVDSGATGCHGYPMSALVATTGSGSDSYLRQTFQQGYIMWDATTKSVVQDIC